MNVISFCFILTCHKIIQIMPLLQKTKSWAILMLNTLLISNISFGQQPIYKNPSYPVEQRIDDLISRMTLEEKVAENSSVIVEAWMCGENSSNAVADVLFGDFNPGGKLPVTFPRNPGPLIRQTNKYNKPYKITF